MCQMRREEDFKSCFCKFCLDTRNDGGLPLDPACLEHLSVQSSAGLPYHIIGREKRHCSCTSRCRLRSTCGGVLCAERMLPDPSSLSIPVMNSPFAAPKTTSRGLGRAVGVNEIHVAFNDFATDVQQDLRAG